MNRGPVFVLGNPKSGTTLVQSLLDGHPELFVVPVELKFFKFVREPSLPPGNMPPPPYPEWKTPITREQISEREFKERIINHSDIGRIVGGEEVARNIKVKDEKFDASTFKEKLFGTTCDSYKEVYTALLESFRASLSVPEKPTDDWMYVEKTPHLEEYAMELSTWFPNARFIHILRNPYANIYSLRKGRRTTPNLRDAFYRPMAKSHYFMERNQRYIENYKIVRYEDVVLRTEETMAAVADDIGVSEHPSLHRPTILGRPWGGNSRSTQGDFDGIDQSPVDAFRDQISAVDIALINRFFLHLINKYKYRKLEISNFKKWIPSGLELPTSYYENRRLLFDRVL